MRSKVRQDDSRADSPARTSPATPLNVLRGVSAPFSLFSPVHIRSQLVIEQLRLPTKANNKLEILRGRPRPDEIHKSLSLSPSILLDPASPTLLVPASPCP